MASWPSCRVSQVAYVCVCKPPKPQPLSAFWYSENSQHPLTNTLFPHTHTLSMHPTAAGLEHMVLAVYRIQQSWSGLLSLSRCLIFRDTHIPMYALYFCMWSWLPWSPLVLPLETWRHKSRSLTCLSGCWPGIHWTLQVLWAPNLIFKCWNAQLTRSTWPYLYSMESLLAQSLYFILILSESILSSCQQVDLLTD